MVRIVRVDTLDNGTLDIELNNGNLILFDITKLLREDSSYTQLNKWDLLPRPLTDGKRIFWKNGPSISLEEIFEILESGEEKNEGGYMEYETKN